MTFKHHFVFGILNVTTRKSKVYCFIFQMHAAQTAKSRATLAIVSISVTKATNPMETGSTVKILKAKG
jgi:hypothetical protein